MNDKYDPSKYTRRKFKLKINIPRVRKSQLCILECFTYRKRKTHTLVHRTFVKNLDPCALTQSKNRVLYYNVLASRKKIFDLKISFMYSVFPPKTKIISIRFTVHF